MIKIDTHTVYMDPLAGNMTRITTTKYAYKKLSNLDKFKQSLCKLMNVVPDKYAGVQIAGVPSSYIEETIWTVGDLERLAQLIMYNMRKRLRCVPYIRITSAQGDCRCASINIKAYVHYKISEDTGTDKLYNKPVATFDCKIDSTKSDDRVIITTATSVPYGIDPNIDNHIDDVPLYIEPIAGVGSVFLRTYSGTTAYTTILQHICEIVTEEIDCILDATKLDHGDSVSFISYENVYLSAAGGVVNEENIQHD